MKGIALALVGLILMSGHSTAASPVDVGLQAPPLVFPSVIIHYQFDDERQLAVTLTHQRAAVRTSTRLGLSAQRVFETVDIGAAGLRPKLGLGAELGRLSVTLAGTTSRTPFYAVRLLGGAEYRPADAPWKLVAEVWNAVSIQPFGIGWGGAIGVGVQL